MKKPAEKIKEFWDEQAKQYQKQSRATNPDILGTDLEIKSIAKYLKPKAKILDLGCGNGFSTIALAKIVNADFIGQDYSDKMIEFANLSRSKLVQKLQKRVHFAVGDVLRLDFKNKFDQITTCRCLINLPDFPSQKKAIVNIHRALKKDGTYIMCENTLDGLENINALRKIASLPLIAMRWHNQYFREKQLLTFVKKYFTVMAVDNFESLYFLMSRVFNAKLTPKNQPPNYLSAINRMAASLPSFGEFSPSKIFVLKKK